MIQSPAVEIPAAAAAAAASVKRAWRAGESPDAAAALAAHPFLLHFKSVVVDLAYEEYCLREERGSAPDPEAFAGRMPAYRSSVFTVLQAHRLVADHPDLLAAPAVDWPAAGDEVAGLTVRAELGRGSFARAYLAYDPETDRDCVLKLSPTRGGEGRALGPLSHPHITDVYWARRAGGLNAVCMPLVGTVTLDDLREDAFWRAGRGAAGAGHDRRAAGRSGDLILDRAETAAFAPPGGGPGVVRRGDPYPVAAAAVAARVADALAYLHARGREHGDLKPSNVVVGPGGHPYLIDFNLSVPADAAVVGTGGTVPFLAPERLRALAVGEPPPPDRGEADVFAFGVTAFALFTGGVPWVPAPNLEPRAAAADQLARRLTEPRPRWPGAAEVPAKVARVVEGCLAADPAARPTAAAVAADLDRWVEGRRVRRRWPRAAAAGLAVVAAAALLVFVRTSDPAPDAPEPRTPEEFIQRGRELVAEGRVEAAVADFAAAVTLEPTGPRPLAYLAYGLTMRASKEAVDAGRDAVAAGAGNAAVYTNLGSAYLQRGKPGLALEVLDEAVLLDPELVPARYNRAIARFRTSVRDARLPDRGCVDDMLVVLRADPPAAEVYFQAARMWAASAHLDPSLRDRAVEFLAAAARLGDDPSKFAAEPTLEENLRGHRGYEQVCGRPKLPGSARQMNLRSVDPDPR